MPSRMTIGRRLFLIITAVSVILMLMTAGLSYVLLFRGVMRIERQLVNQNMQLAVNSVTMELDSLGRTLGDWACWDDTCTFMETRGENFITDNFQPGVLENLDVQSMSFVATNGTLFYTTQIPSPSASPRFISDDLQLHLTPQSPLLRHPSISNEVAGLIALDRTVLMVAARPIISSERSGPSRGTLVIARRLDPIHLQKFSKATQLSIDMAPARHTPPLPNFPSLDDPQQIIVSTDGDHTVTGHTYMKDIYGRPAIALTVAFDRTVYRHGIISVQYVTIWLVLMGSVLTAVTLMLLKRYVLSVLTQSISRVHEGVLDVTGRGSTTGRLDQKPDDEIGRLADAINDMLGALDSSHRRSEQQRIELIQAHKMSSLGTLVSALAHEVNNPNSVIMLNAGSLEDLFKAIAGILDDIQKTHPNLKVGNRRWDELRSELPLLVAEISGSSARIAHMVDELKRFSRKTDSSARENVNLNNVIRSALTLVRYQCDKLQLRLEVELALELPPIRGNYQHLEQVVINLLQNAWQASTGRNKTIRIETGQRDGKIYLRIRDQGCGIPREHMARLTQPFFTTRGSEGGTGLGLSISNRIVFEHKGTLSFESTVGEGTTATIEIPVTEPHAT